MNSHRYYKRSEPERGAKKIFIFCEGSKREPQYFRFFTGLDSRIKIEIYNTGPDEDNSPTGLFESAKEYFSYENKKESSRIEFLQGIDELWFVIDTDAWKDKIAQLRALCENESGWYIAQSNPCFEVWLYYHFYATKPDVKNCSEMKQLLNESVDGGFNSTRHPIYIDTAINHAKEVSCYTENLPDVGSTEVYRLAEQIYPFIEKKILSLRRKLNQ